MKKFTKFCLIIALVLAVVGGALVFIRASLWGLPGKGWQRLQRMELTGFLLKAGCVMTMIMNLQNLSTILKIPKGEADKEFEFDADQVRELDVDTKYAYVSVIRSSDKDKIRVRVYSNKDKVNFHEDDGRLSVERSYRRRSIEKYPIQIEIPKDKKFEEAKLHIGAGALEVQDLEAEKLTMYVGEAVRRLPESLGPMKQNWEQVWEQWILPL